MPEGKGLGNVLEVSDAICNIFEMTILCLEAHAPVPSEWTTPACFHTYNCYNYVEIYQSIKLCTTARQCPCKYEVEQLTL